MLLNTRFSTDIGRNRHEVAHTAANEAVEAHLTRLAVVGKTINSPTTLGVEATSVLTMATAHLTHRLAILREGQARTTAAAGEGKAQSTALVAVALMIEGTIPPTGVSDITTECSLFHRTRSRIQGPNGFAGGITVIGLLCLHLWPTSSASEDLGYRSFASLRYVQQ
jgi:hypothetical protein